MNQITFYTEEGKEMFLTERSGIVRLTFPNNFKHLCFISTLIVDICQRERGIGTQLLKHAEHVAKCEKCTQVTLEVDKTSWLKDWYLKNGYSVVALGYQENHVLVTKSLL